jgi:predicted TIM-barrel fold metal-dependent hydrolase
MSDDQVKGRAAEIRSQLDHPVIDADGHWLLPAPVFRDFLRDAGGVAALDALDRKEAAQHRELPFAAPVRWISVNDARDWATAQLPALLYDRLDEFGLDVAFVYPTSPGFYIPEAELRLPYIRAYNTMVAELFAPFADRLVPVAIVPSHTPDEAMDEAAHIRTLGLRAVVMNGYIRRPYGPGTDPTGTLTPGQASYIDSLALDSPYDYEPVWTTFEELGLAVTTHGGSLGWENRRSPDNYVFNHLGHFAEANHTFARALFMGGVPQRHPRLPFLVLEGGVGWAVMLLNGLVDHWAKRSRDVMLTRFAPARLAKDQLRALILEYGATTYREHLQLMCRDDMLSALSPGATLEELTANVVDFDFDRLDMASPHDIRTLFARSFAFGCEADDPMNPLALDTRIAKTTLRTVLGSDIGHWDVMDMSQVLVEAFEMVDDGLVTESDFRAFTFGNAVHIHSSLNPTFFDGTVIEDEARRERPSADDLVDGE